MKSLIVREVLLERNPYRTLWKGSERSVPYSGSPGLESRIAPDTGYTDWETSWIYSFS